MSHIVVDDDQAKIILEASGTVEVRDRRGRHLGFVEHGFTEADIALAKQRLASGERRHSTQEVLEHLRSLGQR